MEKIAQDVTAALNAGVRASGDMKLKDMARTAIRVALMLLHSNEGLYLELVRNWYRLPTHKVADVLQQYFLELLRVYFAKHHRDLKVEDLHVKTFIIVNSTIFTVVRYLSGEHPLMTEEDIAKGLRDGDGVFVGVALITLNKYSIESALFHFVRIEIPQR